MGHRGKLDGTVVGVPTSLWFALDPAVDALRLPRMPAMLSWRTALLSEDRRLDVGRGDGGGS